MLLLVTSAGANEKSTLGLSFDQKRWQIERDFMFLDIDKLPQPEEPVLETVRALVYGFISSDHFFSYEKPTVPAILPRTFTTPCVSYIGATRSARDKVSNTTICYVYDKEAENIQYPFAICGRLLPSTFQVTFDYHVENFATYDERLAHLEAEALRESGRLSLNYLNWRDTRESVENVYDSVILSPLLRRDVKRQVFFIGNSHICYQRIGRIVEFVKKAVESLESKETENPKW